MSTVIEEFVAKLGWDVDNSKLIGFQRGVERVDGHLSNMSAKMTGMLKRGFFALTAGAGVLGGAVALVSREFSKIEDAQASFTPLLGGASKAAEMVKQLNDTAATTPFQFENLAGVAQQLLPIMNQDIGRTIEFTRMLGDTAGGNAKKMDSITRGFTKSMLKGKVDMESLNIIAEAGVPIFQELGTTVGLQGSKMFDAMRKGKISTDDLIATFKRMTSKGGIYFMGMEIASRTLSGKISTLKDNVGQTAAAIGEQLSPFVKALTDRLIIVAQKAKDWILANKGLIRSKLLEYVKQIPKWIEKIVYWVPKIAKLIGVFYAISMAVKVSTVAINAFTVAKALAGSVTKLKPLLGFFGSLLPTEIGKATSATGGLKSALGKAGLVGAAAGVGVAFGLAIHENVIDPILKAQDELYKLSLDVADTMGRDVSKRSDEQLKRDIAAVQKTRTGINTGFTGALLNYLPGMGMFQNVANTGLDREQKRLEGSLANAGEFERSRGVWDFMNPSLQFTTPAAPSSAGGPITINNVVNVKSNADAKQISRATGQAIEKKMRQVKRNMSND